jgi:hypothetical protein
MASFRLISSQMLRRGIQGQYRGYTGGLQGDYRGIALELGAANRLVGSVSAVEMAA